MGIGWAALSPEMRLTELTAALKDKAVCAAVRAAGLELPRAADARPVERERSVDARRRWEAWEHWWPRSGDVRRDFTQREMAFAARNQAMVAAAAIAGEVVDVRKVATED